MLGTWYGSVGTWFLRF